MPRTKKEKEVETKISSVEVNISDEKVTFKTDAEYLPTEAVEKVVNNIVKTKTSQYKVHIAFLEETLNRKRKEANVYFITTLLLLIYSIIKVLV